MESTLAFCIICPFLLRQAPHGNTSENQGSLILPPQKRQIYRYNVCFCSSVVLADILEHKCNPAGENETSFVVGTCVLLLLA